MIIKQLSVFLENKKGRLFAAADTLAQNGINIRALSLADTSEFGILRLIVDQPEHGKEVLAQSGVIVRITNVLGVLMDDVPGGTLGALHLMADAGINVEYMYACVGKLSGKAIMVIRTDNPDLATEILECNGYADIKPEDVYRI